MRVTTSRTRELYLECMSRIASTDVVDAELVPCWPEHDEETLLALERVLAKAKHVQPLCNRFRFAGLIDAARTPITQMLLDRLAAEGSLHWASSEGFRGIVPVDPSSTPIHRINVLALNLATRRASGLDTSTDEAAFAWALMRPYDRGGAGGYDDYVQWGFFQARTLRLTTPSVVDFAIRQVSGLVVPDGWLPWSTHTDAAQAFLDVIPLSIEDAVRVAEAIPYKTELPRWHGINLASPGDGGVTQRPNAIELVPQMRLALYTGNFRVLHDLARVTRLVERDEDYLLAALERGPAQMRRSLVELVDERDLSLPRTIEAVRRLRDDLDDGVARAARDLCSTRGW